MDVLYVLLALYFLVGIVTFWLLFFRFLRRPDLRGKSAWDEVDASHGFLVFFLTFFTVLFVVAVANPIRFAHVIVKAAFWPVTAWFAIAGPSGEQADSTSSSRGPRLPATYFTDGLERAGRPVTPHNLFAFQERLGIVFTSKARQLMEELGDIDDWERFVAHAGYPTSAADMPGWPQRVLDAIVVWDEDAASHLEEFPQKYLDMLLETYGAETGFFSGPASGPLPTATDWNMKGLAQPGAQALAPPDDVPAPSPRRVPTSVAVAATDDDEVTGPIAMPMIGAGPTILPSRPTPGHTPLTASASARTGARSGSARPRGRCPAGVPQDPSRRTWTR